VRAAGVEVEFSTDDDLQVPPAVALTIYRVVQEALTNVTRHAGATTAVIRVRPDREDVLVEVEDNGSGGVGVPGNGILGMNERARALGGSLTTGPREDGGFRVCARLPLNLPLNGVSR
jgi:signal transduction histidine kinase